MGLFVSVQIGNIILNTSDILFPIVPQHLILVLGSNRKKAISAGWWIKLVSGIMELLKMDDDIKSALSF